MSADASIDAYFERIGFAGSIAPTLTTLEQLHQLHPAAIPFENLSSLMRLPVRLELRNLEQKLLFEKRGGYCIEHNLLFKAMLEDLGFAVTPMPARVLWGLKEGEEAPAEATHLVLAVEAAGTTYLADVGFGGMTLTKPLRLRNEAEQATPHETFRLLGDDAAWRLEVQIRDEWRPVYSFTMTELSVDDVTAMNDLVWASARFRDNLVAARTEKGRRHALFNQRYRVHTIGGETESRMLANLSEIKEVLAGPLGIPLPAADRLDPALEAMLAREQPPGED